jgi:hypothetical protein
MEHSVASAMRGRHHHHMRAQSEHGIGSNSCNTQVLGTPGTVRAAAVPTVPSVAAAAHTVEPIRRKPPKRHRVKTTTLQSDSTWVMGQSGYSTTNLAPVEDSWRRRTDRDGDQCSPMTGAGQPTTRILMTTGAPIRCSSPKGWLLSRTLFLPPGRALGAAISALENW